MLREQCTVGMRVLFGRPNGVQTLGKIVKMNPTKAKVETLEERGTGRGSGVGAVWTVPYSLMYPTEGPVGQTAKVPAVFTGESRSLADAPFVHRPFDHAEGLIMEAVCCTYSELSPENLSGDGELPIAYVNRRRTMLNRRLRHLFGALGRPVSETVAFDWMKQRRESFDASH